MSDARTTIVILDHDELTRRGLRALLQGQGGLHVDADCGTVREAAAQLARSTPQVLVMDPALPDADGVGACRRILQQHAGVRVVMLVERVDERTVTAAVRAGATAVLSKRAALSEMCEAIRAAAAGVARLDAPSTAALFDHVRGDGGGRNGGGELTELEARVLARVVAGRTNREIGHELGLGEKTVKSQLSRAFAKLHVSRRTRAAVLFVADGHAGDGLDGRQRIA